MSDVTDTRLEAFSELLDGETDAAMHKSLLDDLADDRDARARLARYRLIGDALRGEDTRVDALGMADRVRDRLQREPVVLAPHPARAVPRIPRWWQPAAGLAIAASVALLAVGLVPRLIGDAPDAAPASVQVVGVPVASPVFVSATDTQWSHSEPVQESRLTTYLADHSEAASQTGMPGIVPYASFVSYDGEK